MAKKMYERIGAYYYFFPTYKQGKKIIWNGMDREGFKFTDHIPEKLRKRTDNSEMLIEMKNGSIFQVIGTDNIDSVVGTNPIGCVFSEYALQDPAAWDYIRPILAENGGWAAFNYTPRGKNHGYNLFKNAQASDRWYAEKLTVDDTNAISRDALDQERAEILANEGGEALYLQEYYCSFDAPVPGAYYGNFLVDAENQGRITRVPYDPATEVHTYWDLGIDDNMSIWFAQHVGFEIRFIDYYENSGEGLSHYVKYIKEKPYIYGEHYAPHDIEVRELTTGKTRRDTARTLGINFRVAPRLPVADGIQAVRNLLPRCYFDEVNTEKGLSALRSYHKEFDSKNGTYKNHPVHDWASHGADSFRTFAVVYKPTIVDSIYDQFHPKQNKWTIT